MGNIFSSCFRDKSYDDLRHEVNTSDFSSLPNVQSKPAAEPIRITVTDASTDDEEEPGSDVKSKTDTTESDRDIKSKTNITESNSEIKSKTDTAESNEDSVEVKASTSSVGSSQPPQSSLKDETLDFSFLTDAFTVDYIQKAETRIMFIMRGIQGSGKSTIVKEIIKYYPEGVVCSADHFFMKNGKYVFDRTQLSAAHQLSQSDAESACSEGRSVVIIDNTNVQMWELLPYVKTARKHGYTYVFAVPQTSWRHNAEELSRRNTHNVNLQDIQKKLRQYEEYIPIFYGWFLNLSDSVAIIETSKRYLLACAKCYTQLQLVLFGDVKDRPGDEFLSYYRFNTEPKKLHCTSKFMGFHKNPAPRRTEYHENPQVQKSYGKAAQLRITGLVISSKVVGLRIKLDDDQISLYDKPEEIEADKLYLQKRYLKEQISILDDTELPNFTNLPPKGRSAHLTIATAEGIPPKVTNDVMLEICDLEFQEEMQGKVNPGVRIEGGTAKQLCNQYWTVMFDEEKVVTSLFSGF